MITPYNNSTRTHASGAVVTVLVQPETKGWGVYVTLPEAAKVKLGKYKTRAAGFAAVTRYINQELGV